MNKKAEWKQNTIGRRVEPTRVVNGRQYNTYETWETQFERENATTWFNLYDFDNLYSNLTNGRKLETQVSSAYLFKRLTPDDQALAVMYKLSKDN